MRTANFVSLDPCVALVAWSGELPELPVPIRSSSPDGAPSDDQPHRLCSLRAQGPHTVQKVSGCYFAATLHSSWVARVSTLKSHSSSQPSEIIPSQSFLQIPYPVSFLYV